MTTPNGGPAVAEFNPGPAVPPPDKPTFAQPQAPIKAVEPPKRIDPPNPVFEMPVLPPYEVAAYARQKWEFNLPMRLIHAAFHTTVRCKGKVNLRPDHVPVRIVSTHGVGKTGMVASYARAEGLPYVKLDCQVTDIADVFGLKSVTQNQETGRIETISALPDWWPDPRRQPYGIVNVDDMSRALPHVLQGVQQFIFERGFGGVKLPPGWIIVMTDNPDTGVYNVSALDPAQFTRMITLPWNPPAEVFFEQLDIQEVHDDLKSFWMGNPELCQSQPTDVKAPKENHCPRMWMLFNRLYDIAKHDAELLDAIGTATFGSDFMATFSSFLGAEKPITPTEILTGQPVDDRLRRWEREAMADLISLSISRLLHELARKDVINTAEFDHVARFLMKVPEDAGGLAISRMIDDKTKLGQRCLGLLTRHRELCAKYKSFMTGVDKQLDA